MPELKPFEDSDDEIDPLAHKQLLANVNRLNKIQFIKKPSRTEPAVKKNEFQLLKSRGAEVKLTRDVTVTVPDLVKTLIQTRKHLNVGKELRKGQRNKKILPKPLEKPLRERIQRTLAYDRAKQKLNRWNAVITNNQATDHLSFPLDQPNKDVSIVDGQLKATPIRIKSDLMEEMEVIYPMLELAPNDQAPKENLSRKEMILRSKEMRAQRIRESQKSARARLQNKIKSKKFHKIMKKQKIKEQMKDFELLQKTNPELALQKLEEFEKNRVLERALLRHKNTGTWAKNLQVRAKYDKGVRKELSQQLSLSRELTQKRPDEDDSVDEEEEETAKENTMDVNVLDTLNPWVSVASKNSAVIEEADFVSGYRKYWEERNSNEGIKKKYDKIKREEVKPLNSKKKNSKCTVVNGWKVEDYTENGDSSRCQETSDDIDDLFDDAEEILNQKIAKKLDKLRQKLSETGAGSTGSRKKKSNEQYDGLSFKKQAKRPNIDEELDESTMLESRNTNLKNVEFNELEKLASDTVLQTNTTEADNINPDNFMNAKVRHLQTAMPDMDGGYDEEEDDRMATERQMTITEAFEDDDIVADFRQEKDELKNKNGPNELDLTLPGWGSWAGSGIKKTQKKVVLKFKNEEKRRDENKGDVVIIENENKKLRDHFVSSLPFPFTSVKDFEASIRAPVGKDFIPASAHRLLTKPAVITEMGAIIEPMKQEMLLKKPKKPKLRTEKRIAQLKKDNAKNL